METSTRPVGTPHPRAGTSRLTSLRFSAVGAFGAELVAALTVCAVAFEAPHPAPAILGILLLFWAPGHCVAVLADISDPLLFGAVTVAVSIGLAIVVSLALFYLGAWQGSTALVAIACITVGLAGVALWQKGAL